MRGTSNKRRNALPKNSTGDEKGTTVDPMDIKFKNRLD